LVVLVTPNPASEPIRNGVPPCWKLSGIHTSGEDRPITAPSRSNSNPTVPPSGDPSTERTCSPSGKRGWELVETKAPGGHRAADLATSSMAAFMSAGAMVV
jgi:hypothetical protein